MSGVSDKPSPSAGGLTRRAALRAGGAAGAALVLGWCPVAQATPTRRPDHAGSSGRVLSEAEAAAAGQALNAWVRIAPDGRVTLTLHRAEMGQGAYDAVAQMLAEELEVDPDAVDVMVALGNGARYGNQVTGGSSTVRQGLDGLLRTGAAARLLLLRAAAARWAVPVTQCQARRGVVHHAASGRSAHYGELVADASRFTPEPLPRLKPRQHWQVLGRARARRDLPAKVDGTAVYGIDVRRPGQRFAVVARCPRFEGRLLSVDASAALAVPGVLQVLKVERDVFGHRREGVAVVALSTWAAMRGREALLSRNAVQWDDAGLDPLDSATIEAAQIEALQQSGTHFRSKGNPERARAVADVTVDATYVTPYQAHACLEPLNCTALFDPADGGTLHVWGPIQGPDWMQAHLSQAFGLPLERVQVQMTLLGGAFGRKAFTDYVHEAAALARALPRVPVQVLWTRDDDLTLGPFRPGMAYRARGAVRGRADGARLTVLDVLAAGQNIDLQSPGADRGPAGGADGGRYQHNLEEGLPEAYQRSVPHLRLADVALHLPVPVMWWRAVYASTNAFAFECLIDELAHAAEADPVVLRRHALWDARGQRLLERLVALSGWATRQRGAGWGVSLTWCFDSWVGQVVKVGPRPGGGVAIERIWAVIDCGVAANPDGVKAQVEGSIVMALGAAAYHAVRFESGRAVARNFDAYRMPGLADLPAIEVQVHTDDFSPPGGAGEPALPGFAPALANAVFDLTGVRVRRLPMDLMALQPRAAAGG
jgi:isoquinoline 1-oxidoreductase beta subunit